MKVVDLRDLETESISWKVVMHRREQALCELVGAAAPTAIAIASSLPKSRARGLLDDPPLLSTRYRRSADLIPSADT